MANKRERCSNWEKEEKELFRNILKPYLHVIENKDLCTNTNKDKIKAWSDITEKFNVANVRARDKKQLINQWKCLKLKSKKEMSAYRRDCLKTGGGPKPPSPSQETKEIADILPQEFEVDYNEFDCDGIKDITQESFIFDIEIQKPEGAEVEEFATTDDNMPAPTLDFTPKKAAKKKTPEFATTDDNMPAPTLDFTPKKAAKKKTPQASKETFNFAEASFYDMHKFRVLENERQQKEHETRIRHMAEIHSQVMFNLELQTKILQETLEANKNK